MVPPGKPQTIQLHQGEWTYTGDRVEIPVSDLDALYEGGKKWRAWALACERELLAAEDDDG